MTVTESCVEALASAIESGTYPKASKLPAEGDLATQLQVSRATVRDALQTLQERGLIRRVHGSGTFVASRSISKDLNQNSGISQMIRTAGCTPGTRNVQVDLVPAGPDIANWLDIDSTDRVVRMDRVRLADERPVVLSTDFIPENLLAGQNWHEAANSARSLYTHLYQNHGLTIYRGKAELVPVVATDVLAGQLAVSVGAPLLCIKQADFDGTGRAVLYSVEYHVSDWIRFSLERYGPGNAAREQP